METDRRAPGALETVLEVRVVLGRLRRRLREVTASGALTPPQASALARLVKRDHPHATASALAVAEGVRPQSMAATLQSLEQGGLIRRVPDPEDGRRSLVEVTDAGEAAARGNSEASVEWFGRMLEERVTPDERRTVVAAMAILQRVLEP